MTDGVDISVVRKNSICVAMPFSYIDMQIRNEICQSMKKPCVSVMKNKKSWIGDIMLPGHFFFSFWDHYDFGMEPSA